MIHTTTGTVKFRRLSRALAAAYNCSRPMADTMAVGHLERLWHLTISSAKRGDIGRVSDIEIADEIGWEGEPEAIIAILVETGWIDRSDEYRLVIHDWHDHAPGFLHRNIERAGGYVTGVRKRKQNDSGEYGSDRLTPHEAQESTDLGDQALTPKKPKKPNQRNQPNEVGRQSTSTKDSVDEDAASAAAIPAPDPLAAYRLGCVIGRPNSRRDAVFVWKLAALDRVLGEAWLANVKTALQTVTTRPKNPWAYARKVAEDGSRERPGPGKERLRSLLARVPLPPDDWPGCYADKREKVPP